MEIVLLRPGDLNYYRPKDQTPYECFWVWLPGLCKDGSHMGHLTHTLHTPWDRQCKGGSVCN